MRSVTISTKASDSYNEIPFACKILLAFSLIEAIGGGVSYHIAYFFSISTTFHKLAIGFLGFIMGAGAISGSIFGAYFTGKIEIKRLIVASFLAIGLSFSILSIVNAFLASCVLLFLLGFGVNLFLTCNTSSLMNIAKKKDISLRIVQSYKFSFENYGGIIAMFLIMVAAQNHFHSLMFSLGLLFILLAIFVANKIGLKNSDVNIQKNIGDKKLETRKKLLTPILIAVFFVGLTFGIQKTVLGIHLNETIGNSLIIGFFFATDPILIALFQVKISRKLKNINKLSLTSFGCFLLGISTFLMGYSNNIIEMFSALILFTAGEMLFMVNSINLCHEYGGGNHSGLGVGAWRGVYSLGMMIGPLISGMAMFYVNNKSAWIISAILCLIGSLLVLNIKRKQTM